MKVLIWIACLFMNSMVLTLIRSNGGMMGAIPTVALFIFFMWLAKKLCNAWDARQDAKEVDFIRPSVFIDSDENSEKTPEGCEDYSEIRFCRKCGCELCNQAICPKCGTAVIRE